MELGNSSVRLVKPAAKSVQESPTQASYGLKSAALSPIETLAQSVAVICPTGAPVMTDAGFQDAIEAASLALAGGKSVRMPSGAGHDAQILATIMPAGMLFVPSIGGISHHWSENTADADIVTGAQVFVEACRRLLAK